MTTQDQMAAKAEQLDLAEDITADRLVDILLPLAKEHGPDTAIRVAFWAVQRVIRETGMPTQVFAVLEGSTDKSKPMEDHTIKGLCEFLPRGYVLIGPDAALEDLRGLVDRMESEALKDTTDET